ncbi:para-nitrobenzyl esterase [Sphingomonas japonica]|uniref:Carboxylic ester hydrolase n=2 Tax=Sphingomonas japonica TaxID=511662 RepID=A0ABX0U286_9SPHN|nr:para-nitrobenzyl esterase [Sphingomonas japonica]
MTAMRIGTALLALALFTVTAAADPPVVQVTGGAVRGEQQPDRLLFQGIRFAAPPLADNRWRAPRPVTAWQGVADATRQAPACLQNDYGWNRADHVYASEDCLTLAVGTPALTGKRPVFVWIHGGSNRAGSGGGMASSSMVGKDVVVVSIQYRLGIFGFLAHRGAVVDGAAGNYGLMDQIAALRWVQDNIASFGGDPANVTIAGESAGAQDVGLLVASPQARGSFAKAVLQSGTPNFGLPVRPLEQALRIGDQADALLGTGGDIARLRSASAASLLAADLKLHDAVLTADDYLWLRTTVDGKVIPADPIALMRRAQSRPVLIGSNRFELDLPGGRPARDAFVALSFAGQEGAARRFYVLGGRDAAPDPRMGTIDQQIATDATFRCPAGRMADAVAERGAPVWRYELDAARDGRMTAHALDISYIWGEDRAGGLHLQDYWANFARTGDPNGPGLPQWPRYDMRSRRHIVFTNQGAGVAAMLRADICSLTEAL